MCGRYYVDDDTAKEIEKMLREVDGKLKKERRGDICNTDSPEYIIGKNLHRTGEEMIWGFPQYQKKGLLINARAETVLQRKMFRESVLHRRCMIPARSFYEWDPDRNKVTFQSENQSILYMAGFYNRFREEDRFIILTAEANASVKPVHHRMPLLLERKEVEDWIYDDTFLEFALHKTQPKLRRMQEYEQISLFSI